MDYDGIYALVGFPRITDMARMLCSILNINIPIFTTNNSSEVKNCITQLKKQGYTMIIGDNMANKAARDLNINAILLTSGSDSVSAAFSKALEFHHYYKKYTLENTYYKLIHELNRESCAVFADDGSLLFTDLKEERNQTLLGVLRRLIPTMQKKENRNIWRIWLWTGLFC